MEVLKSKFPIYGVADSAIGGRPENQDAWGCVDTPLGFLVVVCDGMGGGPGGRLASYVAKDTFIRLVCEASSEKEPRAVLRNAESIANDALFREMEKNPSLRGMGTTLVAVLINENAAYVIHCGDSRFYKLRRNSIVYRTRDHSFVEGLVHNGTFTEEQARLSNQANILTRAIGNNGNATPDVVEVPYEKGDRFVLCTDGVWGSMSNAELVKQLTQKNDICAICDLLQQQVDVLGQTQKDGKHDNHTLAIIELKTDSNIKEEMSRKTLYIFIALASILAFSLILNIVLSVKLVCSHPTVETQSYPTQRIEVSDIHQNVSQVKRNEIEPIQNTEVKRDTTNKVKEDSLKSQKINEEKQLADNQTSMDIIGFKNIEEAREFFNEILKYQCVDETNTQKYLSERRETGKKKIGSTSWLADGEKKKINMYLDARIDITRPQSNYKITNYNKGGQLNPTVAQQIDSINSCFDRVENRLNRNASNKK